MKYFLIEVYTAKHESRFIKSITWLNDPIDGAPLKIVLMEFTTFFWEAWQRLTPRHFQLIMGEVIASGAYSVMWEDYDILPDWAGGYSIHITTAKNQLKQNQSISKRNTY